MSKIAMLRFFVIVSAVFCTCFHVSANVKLQGPGSKLIILDKATIDYKMDYSKTYAFYNTTDKNQFYTLDVGGCNVNFKVEGCPTSVLIRHHTIKNGNDGWLLFHDNFPVGTVKSTSISFHGLIHYMGISSDSTDQTFTCNAQFDSSSEPGKYVIDVSLTGDVAPDLVVNFPGAELFTTTTSTTTLAPTTLSTTQASSSTLPTSTPAIISSTVKPPCPQCEERGIEAWLIGLIVAIIVLAILAIILCAVLFCCYRRMQKAKAQKIVQNDQTTMKSTMSTVSTAPGPLVKETNLYGPDMMYFGRDATPVDPNAKSQAANIAPQAISPASATSPMQAPQ